MGRLTDHLCWLWSRLSIYNAPVKALRELGFHAEIGVVPRNGQINRLTDVDCGLGTTPISAKWQAGLRRLGKISCFGGVKPKRIGPNFFWGSIIPIKNTFCEKPDQNRPFLLLAVAEAICNPLYLSLIHIWRCRRSTLCRSRWSPYH